MSDSSQEKTSTFDADAAPLASTSSSESLGTPLAADSNSSGSPSNAAASESAATAAAAGVTSVSAAANVVSKPKSSPSATMCTCNVCGKTFCSVGALKRHNLSIHLKNEIFPCTVAGCGRSFLLKEYLKKHLTRYHKLPPQFPRKKKNLDGSPGSAAAAKDGRPSSQSESEKESGNHSTTSIDVKPSTGDVKSGFEIESSESVNFGRNAKTPLKTYGMKREKTLTPSSGDQSPRGAETKILASLLASPNSTSDSPSRIDSKKEELIKDNTTKSAAPSKGSPLKKDVKPGTGFPEKTKSRSSLEDQLPMKRMRKKRTSSPIKKTANDEVAGVKSRKKGDIVDEKEDYDIDKSTMDQSGPDKSSTDQSGTDKSPLDKSPLDPSPSNIGKGKRRKQKKALVDGWVDPEKLAEDFWKTPEKVAASVSATAASISVLPTATPRSSSGDSAPRAIAASTPRAGVSSPRAAVASTPRAAVSDLEVAAAAILAKSHSKNTSLLSPISEKSEENSKGIKNEIAKSKETTNKNFSPISGRKKLKKKKPNPANNSNLSHGFQPEDQHLLSLLHKRDTQYQQQQQQQYSRRSSTPPSTFGGLASRLMASTTSSSSSAAKGPVIRITGRHPSAPSSAVLLNNPSSDNAVGGSALALGIKTTGPSSNNNSQSKLAVRSYAGPYINEKIAKGLYNRPPTHFLLNYEDTHNWRCMLCGRGNFFSDLGQLYGPFHLAETKLTNSIFSKSTVSLCCRDSPSSIMSEADASISTAASTAASSSASRNRVVSGTKGLVTGSRSPTRSAITSSGNIAAQRGPDSSGVVANPDPEPFEVWLHENCAVWSVGVYMVEGKIYGLEEALNTAAETKCSRCSENGATLGCFKSCNSNFHFPCARKSKCQFNEDNFTIRCPKHAEFAMASKEASMNRDDKIVRNVSVMVH